METTTHNRFITELPPLSPSRTTLHLSIAMETMPHGLAGRQAIQTSEQVPLLVDPTLIYDNFADQRDNYEQTEPATYNNAPLLGILARLHSGHSGYNQLLPVTFPTPKTQPKPAPVTRTTPSQVSSSAPIAIEQKMTSSWDYNGKTYYRYSTTVTNKSPKTLKFLNLSISKLYGPLWGLTKSGDSYVFPAWLNSLPAGKSLEFVYIHSASQANARSQATIWPKITKRGG